MKRLTSLLVASIIAAVSLNVWAWFPPEKPNSEPAEAPAVLQPGMVNCGNLIYGNSKTSKCFSPEFLTQISRDTHITANPQLVPVQLESSEMFNFPFAVMTGEGSFELTEYQRTAMRNYLEAGGFIIASAGCSSQPWRESFRTEISKVFPELELQHLDMSHPVFHTVYEIKELQCKRSSGAHLEGL